MQDEDHSPQQEERTRPRISPQVSDKLSTYGPIALGALIVILLVVGVFSFFRNRATQTSNLRTDSIAQVSPSPMPIGSGEPASKINLSASPPAIPSASPSGSPTTKGGVTKLPETGFPLLPMAAASLGLAGVGIYLRKISK